LSRILGRLHAQKNRKRRNFYFYFIIKLLRQGINIKGDKVVKNRQRELNRMRD